MLLYQIHLYMMVNCYYLLYCMYKGREWEERGRERGERVGGIGKKGGKVYIVKQFTAIMPYLWW